ncbi:MAG: hypothetical protein AAGN66_12335 [Acidobacteriota bacterium]
MDRGLLRLLGPGAEERWRRDGKITFDHELGAYDLSWDLVEDLRRRDAGELRRRYDTPTLLFQGKRDTSVDWRAVVDFAMDCSRGTVAVHLMADADHRWLDRMDYLWESTLSFLRYRGLVGDR